MLLPRRSWPLSVTLGVLAAIAILYRRVASADFVWLDKVCFGDPTWYLHAGDWGILLTHNFYGWINYFRPAVITLFAAQVGVFGIVPGPMHLVSLALHMANTALIGLLARKFLEHPEGSCRTAVLVGAAMLFYGLHPALIEPVAWISCQFELLVSFFMLLGLYLNEKLQNGYARMACVATLFFLAACSKESALSFPAVIALFDWMRSTGDGFAASLRNMWSRQRVVYCGLLLAGLVYLFARYEWLGAVIVPTHDSALVTFQRLQEVAASYLIYLRIVLWPMYALGPIHPLDESTFATATIQSISIDVASALIFLGGMLLCIRKRVVGTALVGATLALLPVLHLVPVAFDASFYHERYAMFAIALVAIYLPRIAESWFSSSNLAVARWVTALAFAGWLLVAAQNIGVTLPLWNNDTSLWTWMKREHPQSLIVDDHLLSTFLENGDFDHATQVADELVMHRARCANCLLNAADLALIRGDAGRASAALEQLSGSELLNSDRRGVQQFVVYKARLLSLEGQSDEAEDAYRAAIAMDATDPQARFYLALLLASHGRPAEAGTELRSALPLFPPGERAARITQFRKAVERIPSNP